MGRLRLGGPAAAAAAAEAAEATGGEVLHPPNGCLLTPELQWNGVLL